MDEERIGERVMERGCVVVVPDVEVDPEGADGVEEVSSKSQKR